MRAPVPRQQTYSHKTRRAVPPGPHITLTTFIADGPHVTIRLPAGTAGLLARTNLP
jgi:hypothetical protein